MEKILQAIMKKYPWFIAMGFMLVIIAVIIGAINAGNSVSYYSIDKATRETRTDLALLRASIESAVVWLPYFKFLGVAMILGGITMALGVISLRLQDLGKKVIANVPEKARPPIPPRPKSVFFMRIFMMLGMLIIIVGLIVSISVGGTAAWVFSHPVVQINAAPTGSDLLSGLARVQAAEAWLEAFKFLGVAFLFFGIINGLQTIIFALKYQLSAIPQAVDRLPTDTNQLKPAPTPGD